MTGAERANREVGPARIFYCLFAATLAGPLLFRTLARSWLPAPATAFAGYPLVVGVSMVLWLPMAAATDRAPLFGRRRLPYLLLAGAVGLVAWILAALLPARPWSWAAVTLMLALARDAATAAAWGAAVDLCRAGRNAPERLAAVLVVGANGPGLIRDLLKGPLAHRSLRMVAAGGALLAASVVVVTLCGAGRGRPGAVAPDELGRFVRGRIFWTLLLICALTSLADGPWTLLDLDPRHHIASSAALPAQITLASRAAFLAAAGLFALICRRVGTQRLLPISLFAAAVGLVILRGAPETDGIALAAIAFAQAFSFGLADTAITSLALRAAPPGFETIGALLPTVAPWTLRQAILEPLLATGRLRLPFSTAVDAAIAAFLLASLVAISASRTR